MPPRTPVLKKALLFLVGLFALLVACTKEELQETLANVGEDADRLVLNVDVFPYATLSQYRFFKGRMADQRGAKGLLPYAPINALFSDYAHKFRWVWMPAGEQAVYNNDHRVLDFPDGTVLVKTFYYDRVQPANTRRIVETRLLYKRNGQWEFADYVWNAEQTEATYDVNGSYTPITWVDDNNAEHFVNYRIPAFAECQTCHKELNLPVPIGPKPQNLNSLYAYPEGPKNQLAKWAEMGYLQYGYPKRIDTPARWDDASKPLQERVRGYVDMNCAHCHRENSHCDYRPMRFAFSETADPVNLGVCVTPDDPLLPQHTYIVARGNIARSLLHYRISSTLESERMPLLGRTVVHEEGRALFTEWINSLSPACQ